MADPKIDALVPRIGGAATIGPMGRLAEIAAAGAVFKAPPPPSDPGGGLGRGAAREGGLGGGLGVVGGGLGHLPGKPAQQNLPPHLAINQPIAQNLAAFSLVVGAGQIGSHLSVQSVPANAVPSSQPVVDDRYNSLSNQEHSRRHVIPNQYAATYGLPPVDPRQILALLQARRRRGRSPRENSGRSSPMSALSALIANGMVPEAQYMSVMNSSVSHGSHLSGVEEAGALATPAIRSIIGGFAKYFECWYVFEDCLKAAKQALDDALESADASFRNTQNAESYARDLWRSLQRFLAAILECWKDFMKCTDQDPETQPPWDGKIPKFAAGGSPADPGALDPVEEPEGEPGDAGVGPEDSNAQPPASDPLEDPAARDLMDVHRVGLGVRGIGVGLAGAGAAVIGVIGAGGAIGSSLAAAIARRAASKLAAEAAAKAAAILAAAEAKAKEIKALEDAFKAGAKLVKDVLLGR